MVAITSSDPSAAGSASDALYRAFWRWHFYAGLLVLPVLMLMALTGGLYLFKDEIEAIAYRPLATVAAARTSTPPQAGVAAAEGALHGRVMQVRAPERPTEAARLVVETARGRTEVCAFADMANVSRGGVCGRAYGRRSGQLILRLVGRKGRTRAARTRSPGLAACQQAAVVLKSPKC